MPDWWQAARSNRISGSGRNRDMAAAHQLAGHRQAFAERRRSGGECVPRFMNSEIFRPKNWVLGALGGPDPYWLLERETALIAAIISNSWHLTPLTRPDAAELLVLIGPQH